MFEGANIVPCLLHNSAFVSLFRIFFPDYNCHSCV